MAVTVLGVATYSDEGDPRDDLVPVTGAASADRIVSITWTDTGDIAPDWTTGGPADDGWTLLYENHVVERGYVAVHERYDAGPGTWSWDVSDYSTWTAHVFALSGVPDEAVLAFDWATGTANPVSAPSIPNTAYEGDDPFLIVGMELFSEGATRQFATGQPAGMTSHGLIVPTGRWITTQAWSLQLTGRPATGARTANSTSNGTTAAPEPWCAVSVVIPTAGLEPPIDPEPVEDLVDDFDDDEINAELWPHVFGVAAEEDGKLTAVAFASGVASGVESVAKYTLAGSQISVQMTPPSAEDSDWAVAAVSLWDAPGGYETFIRVWRDSVLIEGAQGIGIYAAVGGIEAINEVYDVEVPGSADWVRLREDDGTLYLDVSANGITWSVLDSWETPAGIAELTHMSVALEAYRAEASADGDPAWFDYLNVTSPYVIATGTGEAALALGLAGQGGRVATGAGVATLTAAADSAAGAITRTGGGAAVLAASATGTGPTARTGGSATALEISPVGGGARTRTGTGAATLTPGASGTGLATRTGIGAAALAPDAAGSGTAARTGAAAVALAPGAVGAGARHTAGAGAAGLAADVGGTGEETRWYTGAAALDLAATGGGERHAAGTGDAALDLAATGAGERHATGTGAVTLALTTASSGEKGIRGGSRLILGGGGGGDKAAAGASDEPLTVASAVTGAKLAAGQGAAPLTIGVDGVGNVIYIAHRALTIDVGGDGSKDAAGQGGAGLSITSAGDGVKVTTGAGGVTLRLRPSPQGASDTSGTGEATLAAAAGGHGTRHAAGTGTARLSPATAGAGDRHAPGTGRVLLSPVGGGVGTRHAPGAGHAVLTPAAGGAGTRHAAGTGDVALAVFPGSGAVRRVTGTGRARLRARVRFGRRVPGRLVARHHGEIYDARF